MAKSMVTLCWWLSTIMSGNDCAKQYITRTGTQQMVQIELTVITAIAAFFLDSEIFFCKKRFRVVSFCFLTDTILQSATNLAGTSRPITTR